MKKICKINLDKINNGRYAKRYVSVIILNSNNKIVLQQRPAHWRTYPGCLSTFGGKIENNETPTEAAIRELSEELGAIVESSDLISLGAITEAITSHQELIHLFFWKDRDNTISGCYEGEMKCYSQVDQALSHPKIMDDVRYALTLCQRKNLII